MLGQIGLPGTVLLIVVLLIIFGSKNLPAIGRSIGQGLHEFKEALSGDRKSNQDESNNQPASQERKKEDGVAG